MNRLIYPKPRDWNDLEDIVTDVFSREIHDGNLVRFKRFGRQGQYQQGVDVVGFQGRDVIGLQCKNHPNGAISSTEIEKEIKKADKFKPTLKEFIVATSASRDAKLDAKILAINKCRRTVKKIPVSILFWEDICDLVLKYPDLIYKYFTKDFPMVASENPTIPDLDKRNRKTLAIRLVKPSNQLKDAAHEFGVRLSEKSPLAFSGRTLPELKEFISDMLRNLPNEKIARPNKYNLAIGFTTFDNVSHEDVVDIDINLSHLLSSQIIPAITFSRAVQSLKGVQDIISASIFSQNLTIYVRARLIYAFLLGWIFRKSAHFNLTLVGGTQIWRTHDLPHVPAKIMETMPEVGAIEASDVVIVLNFATRHITPTVKESLKESKLKFKMLLDYHLYESHIQSAAHALSIAQEISAKLKNIFDDWNVRSVHLFAAVPALLATLIAFHLNGIKPIHLYYLDPTRKSYILGGTITNNT